MLISNWASRRLASEGRSYEGRITLLGEDTETQEKIQVRGIDDEVSVSSTFEVPLYSYWLRRSNLPFADGQTYRMRVMGEMEGKEIELGNPQGPVYYLKRKGDLLVISPDTPTGIGASVNAVPFIDVRLESHQLSVFGNGLKKHQTLSDKRQSASTDREDKRNLSLAFSARYSCRYLSVAYSY